MNAAVEWYEVRGPGAEGPESYLVVPDPDDPETTTYPSWREAREGANRNETDDNLYIVRLTCDRLEDVPAAGFIKTPYPPTDADLAVYFTPDAVREHEENKSDAESSPEGITDADLREAGKEAPHDELLWKVAYPLLDEIAEGAREIAAKRAAGGASA